MVRTVAIDAAVGSTAHQPSSSHTGERSRGRASASTRIPVAARWSVRETVRRSSPGGTATRTCTRSGKAATTSARHPSVSEARRTACSQNRAAAAILNHVRPPRVIQIK